MKLKYFLYILGFMFLLNSCNNKKFKKDTSLSYWSSNNNGEIIFSQETVDQWNNKHPKNKVKFQPVPEGQSSEEMVLAAVVGKTTPDIYSNMWQGSVEFYAKSHVLIPLDTLKGFNEFIRTRCDSSTIKEITSSDGHIYQIPWKINPIMTLYNKASFSSINLDSLPSTYSSYLSAAKKFKKDFDEDGYVDQWFGNTSVKVVWYQRLFNFYPLYIAASDGFPLIKNNKACFNNKYAIEVFRFLQKLYKNTYFSKDQKSAGADPFIAKKIATKFTGPWEIGYLKKFKPENFEYDFFPMPVPDNHKGPVYTYCDPKNIIIFNTCENPQLAFEFIKTMIDKEGDLKFLEKTGQLPRRYGLDTIQYYENYFNKNPKLKIFAKQAKYIKGIDNCEVITEVLDIISQEYEACVLYNIKSPEKAIGDAEKAVNILLRAETK
ncbi:MAG: extracellular solute-binding protein [Bacteroidetes bacterium]|nr:extracellular solute-binding protein [Bacteroidota bacterium]